jgi:hypothetical protein
MDAAAVIETTRALLIKRGVEETFLAAGNFLDFCEQAKTLILDMTADEAAVLPEGYVESLRKLRDDFEKIVRNDPMIIYKPAHHVALGFHQSTALVRYFYGGNRISKTQAATIDIGWTLTGRHPHLPAPPMPPSVFVIGSNFSKYAPNVFEKKYLTGETGNPLSPLFPPGGAWFYRYDEKKHIIYLCCEECHKKGTPGSCTHPKATLALFSDIEGPGVLAGGQYARGHFDEQINESFFSEASQRIKSVRNSGLIVTETPLFGKGWWTYSILYKLGSASAAENTVPGTDRRIVSLHTIDQFSAGLVPHEAIQADMRLMSESQIEARIYGRHVSDSAHAVFDAQVLYDMREEVEEGVSGTLILTGQQEKGLAAHTDAELLQRWAFDNQQKPLPQAFKQTAAGMLTLFEMPDEHEQYVIGADVAEGLTGGDASAADVFRMVPTGFSIDLIQAAQIHGAINSHIYAEELMKLGAFYNNALLAVESNGPGAETLRYLKELGCWFVFQDVNDVTQALFNLDSTLGVDTNKRTKAMLVSILQNAVRQRKTGRKSIVIRSQKTLDEMESYVQTPTQTGLSFRFGGHGRSHDDCVMSAAHATYVATSFPIFDRERYRMAQEHKKTLAQPDTPDAADTREFWKFLRAEEEAVRRQRRDPYFG